MDNDTTLHKLVVLYADVSGSTRIYETYGDAIARRDIHACLDRLRDVAAQYDGRVLKTIGDEVECVFPTPQRAAPAACAMHEALREASAAGVFETGTIRVKIGWHYGVVEWRKHNIVGATPSVAQQIIGLAKPEEILASGEAVAMLPAALSDDAQLMDTVESCANGAPLEIYKLPWEDDEDVTQYRVPAASATASTMRLCLSHQGETRYLDENERHCSIGRVDGNDIVTGDRFTSRQHADISCRHGRFYIVDHSINGTLMTTGSGIHKHLHNEEGILEGEGVLVFGDAASANPAVRVAYRCE